MTNEIKIDEIKSKVNAANLNYQVSDTCYKRFLIGYRGNIDKAAEALITTIKWRKELNADNISPDEFQTYAARRVVFQHGFDKNQRPMVNVIVSRHDKYHRDIEEFRKYCIYTTDQTVKLSKPDEEKYTVFYDLSSFSLQNMDFEAVKVFLGIVQAHYPECLGSAYIVDAPFIFSACWNIIKRWIDPVTASKYIFISSSKLLTIADYDQLSPEIIDIYHIKKPIIEDETSFKTPHATPDVSTKLPGEESKNNSSNE
mmetsp:Transcript_7759/g.6929  ORF Transcript_7759/g.6929 Transcript_7759/m.6929 type:complete len:256 (+) Transcript_7759:40-807(+)